MLTNLCLAATLFAKMVASYPAIPADAATIAKVSDQLAIDCCNSENGKTFPGCDEVKKQIEKQKKEKK
jgi:hypothetical protein